MEQKAKTICIGTLVTLLLAGIGASISYTTYLINDIKDRQKDTNQHLDILYEKITNIQITIAKINANNP